MAADKDSPCSTNRDCEVEEDMTPPSIRKMFSDLESIKEQLSQLQEDVAALHRDMAELRRSHRYGDGAREVKRKRDGD